MKRKKQRLIRNSSINKIFKTTKMKSFQTLFFILTTLFLTGCGDKTKSETEANSDENPDTTIIEITKAQFDGAAMQLGKMTEQSFPKVVQTTGMIDVPPQNRAAISTFAGGYVKKTPLLIGDKVRKGQVLLTLENPEFVEMQQNYLEAVEQLTFLKSEYERQKTLVEEKITSQKNFLKAESTYKRTLATYNGLKKKLQMLNINTKVVEEGTITSTVTLYAPIHGSISKMNVSTGTYVSPADEIMEIINMDHVHLELSVFEKDILQVKEGQGIVFKIPEASEDFFDAEVHLVGTSIDVQNRTVKVHGHLAEDEGHDFAMGMFVDARIITESNKEWALPNESVISIEDKNYILLNVTESTGNYSFSQMEVEVGDSFNGFTMIKNNGDFNENDSFLIKGGFSLIQEEE